MTGNSIAPLQPGKRIDAIDIVRGFALFGILVENMLIFKYPILFDRYPSSIINGIDKIGAWFIQIFFSGKFYMIFAFLFGLGFYIFLERIKKKEGDAVPLYVRRLLVLLIIGLMHMFLLWIGDILVSYALIGFLLLVFKDSSLGTLKKWFITLAMISILFYSLVGLYNGYMQQRAGDMFDLMMAANTNRILAYYLNSGYLELLSFRITNEVPNAFISMTISVPSILALFLLGFFIGKKRTFYNIADNLILLKKITTWGLILGALSMILFVIVHENIWQTGILFQPALLLALNHLASFFIFPAYITIIIILLQKRATKSILRPLAPAGRMSLTNYLSQTVICIIIFNGFGFGLINKIAVMQGIIIAVAIFIIQVIWSNLWLRKFRYGPMEWIWRVLTYKQLQPFAIKKQGKFDKEMSL